MASNASIVGAFMAVVIHGKGKSALRPVAPQTTQTIISEQTLQIAEPNENDHKVIVYVGRACGARGARRAATMFPRILFYLNIFIIFTRCFIALAHGAY